MSQNIQTNAKPSSQGLVEAIVARGRSIDVPTGEKQIAGTTPEGKEVFHQTVKHFREGAIVRLPADEVRTLRASGHLVDPQVAPVPVEGPTVVTEEPTQVRPA